MHSHSPTFLSPITNETISQRNYILAHAFCPVEIESRTIWIWRQIRVYTSHILFGVHQMFILVVAKKNKLLYLLCHFPGVLLDHDSTATKTLQLMQSYVEKTNQDKDILPGIELQLIHHNYRTITNSFAGLQSSTSMLCFNTHQMLHSIFTAALEAHLRDDFSHILNKKVRLALENVQNSTHTQPILQNVDRDFCFLACVNDAPQESVEQTLRPTVRKCFSQLHVLWVHEFWGFNAFKMRESWLVEIEIRMLRRMSGSEVYLFAACDMMEQNVVVVIGPSPSSDVRAVHPVCAGLHIPQIAPLATDPNLIPLDHPYLIRVKDTHSFPALLLIVLHLWKKANSALKIREFRTTEWNISLQTLFLSVWR